MWVLIACGGQSGVGPAIGEPQIARDRAKVAAEFGQFLPRPGVYSFEGRENERDEVVTWEERDGVTLVCFNDWIACLYPKNGTIFAIEPRSELAPIDEVESARAVPWFPPKLEVGSRLELERTPLGARRVEVVAIGEPVAALGRTFSNTVVLSVEWEARYGEIPIWISQVEWWAEGVGAVRFQDSELEPEGSYNRRLVSFTPNG